MAVIRVEREIGGRMLTLEAGKVAKQAHGAVVARYADTVVLATVLSAPPTRDIDFFPLYVDYRECQYAAGKVPGGFFKREGRPSTKEILTCRMIDRPIRPLFPDDFTDEVQIQCLVLSFDQENDPDVLSLIASSAALALSPAPFQGPVAAVRMGYVDGKLTVLPTLSELEQSMMDLVVVANPDAVNMLELAGKEVPEDIVAAGIEEGTKLCHEIINMIQSLVAQVPVTKKYEPHPVPPELLEQIEQRWVEPIRQAKQITSKVERSEAMAALQDEALAELSPEDAENPPYAPRQVKAAFYKVEGKVQRALILDGKRPDGRRFDEVRPLSMEVGFLPRTHGSALFTRGETQSLAITTLGTTRDRQIIDGLQEEYRKAFILHYNFPPFSVGEIRPIRGPGRRDIGHGALAEKSLQAVMPNSEDFPYTIRLVSDILESNGSTSMAAVCGGTLSLMDAGVPITGPVGGVSIGMVSDGDRYVLLTDLMGEEDFHGDMDFKVAGTRKGVTGIQMDMKARGIRQDQVVETLARARQARLQILDAMAAVISQPREKLSQYAPRVFTLKINPEKIGKVIGPGGKTITRIQTETGATIDVQNDGTVSIFCVDADGGERAVEAVRALTEEPEVGKIYTGRVVSVQNFGAFVEILPGCDGLCHVSELDVKYVKKVTDVCNLGDEVRVKVIGIDDQGRIKLSRKALLQEEEAKSGES